MVKTAINLYSVRELDESMPEILDRVADAGYDGVQFSGGLRGSDPDDIATQLTDLGLETTGAHVGIESIEDDYSTVHQTYHEILKCGSAVVPYLGDEHFASETAVEQTAERLESLAQRADESGWDIHYHNHAHEFVDFEDGTAFEYLFDITDHLGLELDVGWALVGGSDPVRLIERYGDRIDLLHMKDMAVDEDRGFREIGEGDVDMAGCAEAAKQEGVEWLIYEHDEPADPVTSLETGAQFLNNL